MVLGGELFALPKQAAEPGAAVAGLFPQLHYLLLQGRSSVVTKAPFFLFSGRITLPKGALYTMSVPIPAWRHCPTLRFFSLFFSVPNSSAIERSSTFPSFPSATRRSLGSKPLLEKIA